MCRDHSETGQTKWPRPLNHYSSDTMSERTRRPDFQATSDPGLRLGEAPLLGYGELFALWERQQWSVHALDFSQDRIDWHERIPPEERYERMYGLSAFFVGEQRVA